MKRVSAPGKAILVGEHAVVYGQPAIALPLPQLRASACIRASQQPLTIRTADLPRPPLRWQGASFDPADPIARITALTLDYLNVAAPQGEIKLQSDIPIASGLGSGAAVSAALSRALAALCRRELPLADLNRLVFEVEKLHHGQPSGIDNTTIVYNRPLYFVKGGRREFIRLKAPLQLLIADSGIAALTRAAVAAVRARHTRQPEQTAAIFAEIGALVDEARQCIEAGNQTQLGQLMTANHRLLKALAVSSVELDRLVAAALAAGALGAKLSGGGRGGNIIALVEAATEAAAREKLLAAGARRVYSATVEQAEPK